MNVLRRFFVLVVFLFAAGTTGGSGVGPMLPIAIDAQDNRGPAAAYSPAHDSFLAVWWSEQDIDSWDIWARAVAAEGSLLSTFLVDGAAGENLFQPAVAYSTTQDEYLVAYSRQNSPGDIDIVFRVISWNGPGTSSRGVIAFATGGHPAVAYNSVDDEYVIVYQKPSVTGNSEIWAVRTSAAGSGWVAPELVAWGQPLREERSHPDVAYDPVNNRYLVVYEWYNNNTDDTKILLRTVSADLAGKSPEYEIASTYNPASFSGPAAASIPDAAKFPSIAAGPAGALVAYELRDATTSSIYARRTLLDATPLGPSGGYLVLGGTNLIHKMTPDVCTDSAAGFFLVWSSLNSSDYNVQGRYVSQVTDGGLAPRFGIDTSLGDQSEPAVACTGDGLSLVVMEENPGTGYDDDEVIGYLVSSVVFTDGFETGNCTLWSSVVGEIP